MNTDPRPSDPFADESGVTLDQSGALDGNAASGAFAAAFGVDVSTAEVTCAHCGDRSVLAARRAYLKGPGVTVCCQHCAQILARVTSTPHGTWLSLAGSVSWRLPPPGDQPGAR